MIIRVFEGGDGSTSGGRSEKSRESGDLEPDDARERCGDGRLACMFMFAIMYARKELFCVCLSDLLVRVEWQSSNSLRLIFEIALGGCSFHFRKHRTEHCPQRQGLICTACKT